MSVELRRFCLILLALIFLTYRHRMIIPLVDNDDKRSQDFKHILIWTPEKDFEKLMGWTYPNLDGFEKAGCPEFTCYLTKNKTYLGTAD